MKTKRTNRFLAILLALVMVVGMFPMTALAATNGVTVYVSQTETPYVDGGAGSSASNPCSLDSGVAKVKEQGGTLVIVGSIELVYVDVSTPRHPIGISGDKDIIIKGNDGNAKLTSSNLSNGMIHMGNTTGVYNGTLTVQDLTLEYTGNSKADDGFMNTWSKGEDYSPKFVLNNVTCTSTNDEVPKKLSIGKSVDTKISNLVLNNVVASLGSDVKLYTPITASGTTTITSNSGIQRASAFVGPMLSVTGGNVTLKTMLDGKGEQYSHTYTTDHNTQGIMVTGGTLTIADKGGLQNSYSTYESGGGFVSSGIYIDGAKAKVILQDGGKIINNKGWDGSGVFLLNGDFEMTGGEISGNVAMGYGAGVYSCVTPPNQADISLSGGEITNNYVEGSKTHSAGAGVTIYGDGKTNINIDSVAIQDNGCKFKDDGLASGVWFREGSSGAVVVSGAPKIQNNTLGATFNENTHTVTAGTEERNIFLNTGWTLSIDSDHLQKGANIGVFTKDNPTSTTDIPIATGANAEDRQYFHSDKNSVAGVLYCDGTTDSYGDNNTVEGHHTHAAGKLWLSVAAASHEVNVVGDGIEKINNVVYGTEKTYQVKAAGGYYFPKDLTASVSPMGSAAATLSNKTFDTVGLALTGITGSPITVTISGADKYLGKIGDTYYANTEADTAALKKAMETAAAGTEIILGDGFTANGIQMASGVKVKKYSDKDFTTTNANTLYNISNGVMTATAAAARIGNKLYAALDEALNAAEGGNTVEILSDSVFTNDLHTLKDNVTLSYTVNNVPHSVTAVGEAKVNLNGQKTTLTEGSLKCTGTVYVKDGDKQIHSVSSNDEITVTAGSTTGEGRVSKVSKNQQVKIDSVTYTSAADDTSFPLVGKKLTDGETAKIEEGKAGTATLQNGIEITTTETNTGATTVVPNSENTEVTLGKIGDTVEIGKDAPKQSYTANADNTTLIVGKDGDVTLNSGEVSLADTQSIGLMKNDGTAVNISNPTEAPAVDGDKVIVKGGDTDYAGYVTIKNGGDVQIGTEKYTAPANTEVVYAIDKKTGAPVEISRKASLEDDENTTIFGGDGSVYIENVNNSGDKDTIVVNIQEDTAEIKVLGGTSHQVAIGKDKDTKVTYTNGSDDAEMVLTVNKDETVPTLSEGSVTVPKGKDVKVGETTYTAPEDANMTISRNENGKAVLNSGSVQLDQEESIVGVSGREIQNTSDEGVNNPVVVTRSSSSDQITIPAGGSVTIDGVKYENKGDAPATLIVSDSKVLVETGTIGVTPTKDTPAEVTVGGDSTVVSGTEPFIVTAGSGSNAGTAVANPGQTLTISGVEYTTNPKGEGNTIFDLSNPSAAMKQGDAAVFPNYPASNENYNNPNQGNVTVNIADITFGGNTFTVPNPTYNNEGKRTSGNSGNVSVVKDSEEGAATVTIEKGGDKAIINGEEYTAAADKTILDVDDKGNVTLSDGAVALDSDKDITVNTKKVSVTGGTDPATITKNADGSATITIPNDTEVSVEGMPLSGESIWKMDKDGNVTLVSKTTYLDDNEDTTVNDVTVKNPASPSDDRISVQQGETGSATVTVPAGVGKKVVLTGKDEKEIHYSNASDKEDLVLEITEDGSIKLKDGIVQLDQEKSVVAAPEGGTPTLITNESESDSNSNKITVDIDNENGTTKVTSPGAGTVTIGEGDKAKTFTTDNTTGMEITIDKNGNVALTGGKVNLGSGESITVDGITYIAPEDGSLSVEVDSTGKVTLTGIPGAVSIDPEKFKDPKFKFEMTPGVPVTVGDYVYETETNSVTLSGIENGNGNPNVTLPDAGNVMKVSLAKDPSKTTNYTAAGASTQFAMSGTGSAANTAKSDLLGSNNSSGLTFTGNSPVTVNGVTYQGEKAESTYNVMFDEDGQNKVVLPNDTKVTATFTESEKSLVTDVNKVNGKNADGNKGETVSNVPFTAATAPSSIVISKDTDGKVNVTNGSRSSLLPIKDGNDKIIGYEVKRTSSGGSSSGSSTSSSSGVNVTKPQNGTVTVDKSTASSGQTVTITTKPNEGYKLGNLTVTDSKGNPVDLKDLGDGKYSFVQPKDAPVTIKAIFVKEGECNRDKTCPAYPFADLDLSKWYHDGIHYCVENSLMMGTGDKTFSPHASTSRGMIATILYRLENRPAVSGTSPFEDVAAGKYYTDAIIWAEKNGIVAGYGDNKFGPDDSITREQMAAILYGYAKYKGYDVADKADLSKFADDHEISAWAETALSWANANGFVEGDGNKLMPKGNAERCQVAAILTRFCKNVAE